MSRSAYIRLGGGIDLVTPPEQLRPGAALSCINYECPVTGGYRRIDGYSQRGPTLPGEGPTLGVATFADGTYGSRKDTGAETATLYKLSGTGDAWEVVGSAGTLAAGRHEFIEGNVYATDSGRSLYGVGGGKPFELALDGTLTTLANAPSGATMIALHQNHLFLGFPIGSVQHSGIGDPANWDASTGGAGEIGTSDRLTGLLSGVGGVLHVLCRDSIKTLRGTSEADFVLEVTVPNSGARANSCQSMQQPYFIGERGISSLEATQRYGDFSALYPGRVVEPMFSQGGKANRVIASCIARSKGQYRIFFDDRTGLYLSGNGITATEYPHQVVVAHSGELESGQEQILVGDDAGNVYRLDDGEDFNGTPIRAYLTLAYTDLQSPSARKRFRRVFWDIRSGSDARLWMQPDFDYGDNQTGRPRREYLDFMLGGGLWGVDNWSEFRWSVPGMGQETMDITGTGTSVNFSLFSESQSSPHEILGYDLHFDLRRQRRG
ncbi:hypothetical protein ACUN9Y_13265 [Halomonas sp. V046]|uniref:hypothetical protein n=1 Tax=Halomonas sp. V046 TaxID=3459611 RepID=UPI0040451272